MRHFNPIDSIIQKVDMTIRSLVVPEKRVTLREIPGKELPEASLTPIQKEKAASLMRVNHSGEVSAQALYQGQALTAKLTHIKQQMIEAAKEEEDHLAWCEQRLKELGAKTSFFNPFWYLGSFCIGAFAGLLGDKVSLGFVAETEQQVSAHLQKHLEQLSAEDQKTRLILEKMQADEKQHAETAKQAGGIELPTLVKGLMQLVSKLMTKTSYYL